MRGGFGKAAEPDHPIEGFEFRQIEPQTDSSFR
jgi:hypothetical protein